MVRKPKGNHLPKQVIRQSSEKTLLRQSSTDKISKPLPTSLSTSCMWNGVNTNTATDELGEGVDRNSLANNKKSPLASQKEREKISFGIKSHSAFNKSQEESKFSKQNALGLHNGTHAKRPFQVNSHVSKSYANGKSFTSSGLVPYNNETDDSDNDGDTGRPTLNGHAKSDEKCIESYNANSSSESSKNNNTDSSKGRNTEMLPNNSSFERVVNNSDKDRDDMSKEERKVINSSQGNLHINGRATTFLPRSVQTHSSVNGKECSSNQINGLGKLFNGIHSDKITKDTDDNYSNGVNNVKNGSFGNHNGSCVAKLKNENGLSLSEASERSPSELSTCSSSSSQGFVVTEKLKAKSKSDKMLKERESFNGWNTIPHIPKSELEKSHSQDSVLTSKNHHNDKCETASVKSKESLDSNRSDKSSRSMKKSLFSLFPCVSSTHSPDLSPEEEQLNSVIENKTVSPVRTDPTRIPYSHLHDAERIEGPSVNEDTNQEYGESENGEDGDRDAEDDDDDDDNFQSKRDRDNDEQEPRSPSKKCRPESKQEGKSVTSVNESSVEDNVAERLQNGHEDESDSEDNCSKSKHQKVPQSTSQFVSHSCDGNKNERNFFIRDEEENFSMEEKKSRHKKKYKMKHNNSSLHCGSYIEEAVYNSPSTCTINPNVATVNWNRHVRDLTDNLSFNKYSKTKNDDSIIANGGWKTSNDLSVVNALKKAGSFTFGVEVKCWDGQESLLDKETRMDRNEAKKRSVDDLYNEEFDKGKIRKKRFKEPYSDGPIHRENPFQKFQNDYVNVNDKNTFNNRNHFRSNCYNNSNSSNNNNCYNFKNKFNHYRSHTWGPRSPAFASQSHFRNGAHNFKRNKWFQKHRNNKGKYGREREKFGYREYAH